MTAQAITAYLPSTAAIVQFLTLDALVVAGMFALLLGYALRYGKGSIIALIFSLYTALLLYLHVPFVEQFLFFKETETQLFLSKAGIFIVFVVIVQVILRRVIYGDFPSSTSGRLLEAGLLSASAAALLLAISYQVLPAATLYDFSASVDSLFEPSAFFFLWLIAPLAAVLLTNRG